VRKLRYGARANQPEPDVPAQAGPTVVP
jgi:hypothetical protein